MRRPQDDASRPILLSLLELILQYCRRFYARQFTDQARRQGNSQRVGPTDLLTRFEQLLTRYYDEGRQAAQGCTAEAQESHPSGADRNAR